MIDRTVQYLQARISECLVRIDEVNSYRVQGLTTGVRVNVSKLSVFSSVGCAVRTVKILTGWDFGAHGAPYYDTYSP